MLNPIGILRHSYAILYSEYSSNRSRFVSISVGCFFASLWITDSFTRPRAKFIMSLVVLNATLPHFVRHFFLHKDQPGMCSSDELPKTADIGGETVLTDEKKKTLKKSVRFDDDPVSDVFELSPPPSPTASPPPIPSLLPHRRVVKRSGFGNLGPPQRVSVQRSQDDSDL